LSLLNDGSSKLRAGLYGAGAFGSFLVQTLTESQSVRVTAMASRTYQHARDLAAKEHVSRVHRDFEALISNDELDLIILSTPPVEHGPQALAALAANKHVFVEKPLATQLESAERVIELAASRQRIVAVDYPMPYSPLVEAVTLFAKSRLVGPLLRISVENIASCKGIGDEHWFWNKDISGGIFVEHGVHFFDWCGQIAGDARQVAALTMTQKEREDRVFAAITHTNGAVASYYHAFVAQPETERTRAVVTFESVDVILDGWIPTTMVLHGRGAAVATTTIRRMMSRSVASIPDARVGFVFDAGPKQTLYAQSVRAAIDDMARAIREPGYIARNDARRALPSLQAAVAAREAAERGTTIDLTATRTLAPP
jgi:predicted dehydrogenase